MSEYYQEDEYEYEEESFSLSENDLLEIQEEYRRKRLMESLIGPVISTVFHIGLIVILAIFITDKYKEEAPEIEVTLTEVEEIIIEEPPPIEEPTPEEVEETEVTNPVLTTVAIETEMTKIRP
jgi:hypothetical protein